MSGKPITEISGEEAILTATPFIVGPLLGLIVLQFTGSAENATFVATLFTMVTFALFWPRIVDLGFGLKQPRF